MSASCKTVRVFISSTFRDMHAERDHLVTVVFPELRERVEQLGLEFFDVDLRWGVPAKNANGETANSWEYCRQWIDRVEPFFVCILGQRYGWVPEPRHFRDDADRQRQEREPRSITDLEVRHAVLDQRRKRRSYFYLRATPVPAPNSEYVDAPDYQDRLTQMKTAVRQCSRPVHDYHPEWTGERFTGTEEFGRFVLDDLWSGVLRDEHYVPKPVWRQVLNADPDTDPRYIDESQPVPRELWEKIVALAKPKPKEPLDAEREQMEVFAQARLRWFQGRTNELKQLTDFINSTDEKSPRLTALVAVPGQGKSALLAKLSSLIPHNSSFVISHFVGATERSATAHALVERLLGELDRSGIEWPTDEQKEGEEPKRDFNSLCLRLGKRLGDYAGERRVVILLDALNQLSDGHDLQLLPVRLGPSVRVVVSCVDDKTGKPDSAEHRVLQALTRRNPGPLHIPLGPLTEDDVRSIVVVYLKEYCKELDREHVDVICHMEQAKNPLYLLVLLEELRTLGGNDMNRIVGERIAALAHDYPDTVSLFRWVLQRLEVFGAEAVQWWCLYLAQGRVGMASHELADLLARKLGANAAPTALLIERGLRRYLLRRGAHLDFFHGQLRQAVAERYLLQDSAEIHVEIASYFAEHWAHDRHALSELPYHQIRGQRWDNLEATLTELTFLEAKNTAGMVFDLAEDFAQAIAALPAERPRRRILSLLVEALRRDIFFIARHAMDYPQALFQCLWNSCWWYDSDEAANHYAPLDESSKPDPAPWQADGPRLCELLEFWRKSRENRARGFEWLRSLRPPRIPLGAGLSGVLSGQCGNCLVYSPDGTSLASGGSGGLRVWDTATQREVFHRAIKTGAISAIGFFPDAQRLLSVDSNGVVCQLDARAGTEIACWRVVKPSGSAAVSREARMIAVGEADGTIHIFNTLTRSELCSWRAHQGAIKHVVFVGALDYVCTHGSDETVRVWDLSAQSEPTRVAEVKNVEAVAAAATAPLLAVTCRGQHKLKVLDVVSGSAILQVPVVRDPDGRWLQDSSWAPAKVVAFSADATQVMTGSHQFDQSLRVWDIHSGKELASAAQPHWVGSLACSPDCRSIAVAIFSGDILLWDFKSMASFRWILKGSHAVGTQAQVLGDIRQLIFSTSGRQLLAGSQGHWSRLWDCSNGRLLQSGMFSPLEHDKVMGPWRIQAELLHKTNSPLLREPSWTIRGKDQESALVEHVSQRTVAWFPYRMDNRLVHEMGLVAGASDDHLTLLCLEGKLEPINQRIERREAALRDLANQDQEDRKQAGQQTLEREELDHAMGLLDGAKRLLRQFDETGEMPWPENMKDCAVYPLTKATNIGRTTAFKLLLKMHYAAETTFFRHNNKAAIALSRPQRDLLLSKLLDSEEAFAVTMPVPLKVGVADEAVKQAMFLEDLEEFDSARVLYKRAERIHREMGNSEGLRKVMEWQVNMLRKQMQQG